MYVEKTREQIKQLAIDIAAGLVMTNYGVPDSMMGKVFTPLAQLSAEELEQDKKNDICMYYQYVDKRVDVIDGYPVFNLHLMLNRNETKILSAYNEAIDAL